MNTMEIEKVKEAIKRSYVRLQRIQCNRCSTDQIGSYSIKQELTFNVSRLYENNIVNVICFGKIYFDPVPGPFEAEYEFLARFKVNDKEVVENFTDEQIISLAQVTILPELSLLIAFLSKFMNFPPLVLPPIITEEESDGDTQ